MSGSSSGTTGTDRSDKCVSNSLRSQLLRITIIRIVVRSFRSLSVRYITQRYVTTRRLTRSTDAANADDANVGQRPLFVRLFAPRTDEQSGAAHLSTQTDISLSSSLPLSLSRVFYHSIALLLPTRYFCASGNGNIHSLAAPHKPYERSAVNSQIDSSTQETDKANASQLVAVAIVVSEL